MQREIGPGVGLVNCLRLRWQGWMHDLLLNCKFQYRMKVGPRPRAMRGSGARKVGGCPASRCEPKALLRLAS